MGIALFVGLTCVAIAAIVATVPYPDSVYVAVFVALAAMVVLWGYGTLKTRDTDVRNTDVRNTTDTTDVFVRPAMASRIVRVVVVEHPDDTLAIATA